MNWKRMKVVAAVPVALARYGRRGPAWHQLSERKRLPPLRDGPGNEEQPDSFPDSQESTGKQTDQTGEDDSSFLEKDNNKEDKAQQGNSSDNLFDGEDTSNPENRPTGALAQGDGAAARYCGQRKRRPHWG